MNVLVICLDTLRWDHCGYNKQVPQLSRKKQPVFTPNIDRLAARATIFDRAVIGSFPTIPMRADCFTGNVNFPRVHWAPLEEDYVLLTEVLHNAGYYTGFVHDTWNMNGMGFSRGFDDDVRTLNVPWTNPKPDDLPFHVPKENIRENGWGRQRDLSQMAHFQRESDWFAAQTFSTAAEWLERNGRRDKWFLWVDTFEIHELWRTPDYYVGLYDPGYAGLDYDYPRYGATDVYKKDELRHLWAHYAAEVTLTDRWMGRLLDQLDVMDLWDDTLVMFVSDHGMLIGEHGLAGKHPVDGDTWPLYEEISHIPLLVWCPKKGMKRRVKALAQPADIMPTVLDATGVRGPETDGRSWLPLMSGKTRRNWDMVFSSRCNKPSDKPSMGPTRLCVTTERWTFFAREEGHPAELYDLKSDPGQKRNVASSNPGVVEKLQRAAVQFLRDGQAVEEYIEKYI